MLAVHTDAHIQEKLSREKPEFVNTIGIKVGKKYSIDFCFPTLYG
jgi:hypothetical protein